MSSVTNEIIYRQNHQRDRIEAELSLHGWFATAKGQMRNENGRHVYCGERSCGYDSFGQAIHETPTDWGVVYLSRLVRMHEFAMKVQP